MLPGFTAFTCTPSRIPMSARALVSERTAAFTEPPIVNNGPGIRPPTPEIFNTEPACAFNCGQAARVKRMAPKNFSANPSAQSSSVSSRKSPRLVAPALLTTMSILYCAFRRNDDQNRSQLLQALRHAADLRTRALAAYGQHSP